jgi:hypothetical protein
VQCGWWRQAANGWIAASVAAELFLGVFTLVAGLQVDPRLRIGTEKLCQTQRCIADAVGFSRLPAG